MSKFFDKTVRAQASRPSAGVKLALALAGPERRRSPRWKAHIPVFVYGYGSAPEPFHEQAYSAIVSEMGGLLVMTATVRAGEPLLITNKMTEEEHECRVARVSGHDAGSFAVAVEFERPETGFWRVTRARSLESACGGA